MNPNHRTRRLSVTLAALAAATWRCPRTATQVMTATAWRLNGGHLRQLFS